MKKRLLSLILIALIVFLCVGTAFAAEATDSFVQDHASVLEDASEIETLSKKLYDDYGVASFYYSETDLGDQDLETYARGLADEKQSVYPDMAILISDTTQNMYILYLTGNMEEYYQQEIYDQLKVAYEQEETYQGGVMAYLTQLYSVLYNSRGAVEGTEPVDMESVIPTEHQKELVEDEAGILDDSELQSLREQASRISEEQKSDVAVVYVDSLNGKSAQAYADDYYDYNGYGYGDGDDGILLLIAVSDREYAMTTYGTAIDIFEDSRLEYLEELFVEKLGDDDWYGAGEVFLSQCESYLKDGVPSHTVPIGGIPVSLILGFLLAGIPMKVYKSQLKSVAKKRQAASYIMKQGVIIREKKDNLVNVTRTKTKIEEKKSGSSGGSTTHRSSSGRSHGGRSGKF